MPIAALLQLWWPLSLRPSPPRSSCNMRAAAAGSTTRANCLPTSSPCVASKPPRMTTLRGPPRACAACLAPPLRGAVTWWCCSRPLGRCRPRLSLLCFLRVGWVVGACWVLSVCVLLWLPRLPCRAVSPPACPVACSRVRRACLCLACWSLSLVAACYQCIRAPLAGVCCLSGCLLPRAAGFPPRCRSRWACWSCFGGLVCARWASMGAGGWGLWLLGPLAEQVVALRLWLCRLAEPFPCPCVVDVLWTSSFCETRVAALPACLRVSLLACLALSSCLLSAGPCPVPSRPVLSGLVLRLLGACLRAGFGPRGCWGACPWSWPPPRGVPAL